MKSLSVLALLILFFTGCSTFNLSNNSIEPKAKLIQKANNGNIKAMLALNKHYQFPQTKEGLEYFSKWYKNIDENDSSEDIYNIANVYNEYFDMFINGKEKVQNLYNLASNKGNINADIKKIQLLVRSYQTTKAKKLTKNVLPKLDEKQLNELYSMFIKEYRRVLANEVLSFMKTKNYKLPFDDTLKKLKSLSYKKSKKDEYNSFLNVLIDTQNSENLLKVANFLKSRYYYKDSIKVAKKAILLDKNNHEAYFLLSYIYGKGSYKEKLKKNINLANKYAKKASSLGNEKATLSLLKNYSTKKEYINEFFQLKEQLQKDEKGLLILSKYYKSKRLNTKANNILNDLAKKQNEEAILTLALNKPSRYNFNPDEYKLTQKWQKFIETGNNKSLEEKYKTELFSYKYKRYFNGKVQMYLKKDIENENIITFRKLYKQHKYRNVKEGLKYLLQAVNASDVKSAFDLAQYYKRSKVSKFEEAVKVYEALIKRGEHKAIIELANMYIRPPYHFKDKKDAQKGLDILGQLAKKGDLEATKKLAREYMCGSCNDGKTVNYPKALIYLNDLIKLRDYGIDYASIAWIYHYGKGVEVDLLKAKKYYELAAKKGYIKAYYNLAWLFYKQEDENNTDLKIIRLDYEKAKEYLQEGANKGDLLCKNLLGVFYKDGLGGKKDIKKALELFKSIYKYNPYAAYNLGKYYAKKEQYNEASKYFEASVKRGNSSAMIEMGILFEKGLTSKKDINIALDYYKKAYKKDKNKIAAYNIALVYHYGKGEIKKDLKEAKKWYRLSGTKKAIAQLNKLNKK